MKFCFRNSALGKCLSEVLFPQLSSEGMSFFVKVPQLHSRGNVFMKFHFHNSALEVSLCEVPLPKSALGVMSSRSSSSPTTL